MAHNTPMKPMLTLLFKVWKLEKPNLIISVTGGAQNYTLKPRLRDVFRKGLVKAATSTSKTYGTHCNKVVIVFRSH